MFPENLHIWMSSIFIRVEEDVIGSQNFPLDTVPAGEWRIFLKKETCLISVPGRNRTRVSRMPNRHQMGATPESEDECEPIYRSMENSLTDNRRGQKVKLSLCFN